MESVPLGVRKGAWTEEEDILLKKCIEKHGEGKWHQVPLRAGLNRCRKSCRLRWLNYLRPDIKRGNFSVDEVDLIIRLHKLLGNRWSLIAGRLPGRTSNDVKNYWNTHLLKKLIITQREEVKSKTQKKTIQTKVIRPRPRTFSKNLSWFEGKPAIMDSIQTRYNLTKPSPTPPPLPPPPPAGDEGISWLDNMLVDSEINNAIPWSIDGSNEEPLIRHWAEKIPPGLQETGGSSFQGSQSDWSDIFIDNLDLWDP